MGEHKEDRQRSKENLHGNVYRIPSLCIAAQSCHWGNLEDLEYLKKHISRLKLLSGALELYETILRFETDVKHQEGPGDRKSDVKMRKRK